MADILQMIFSQKNLFSTEGRSLENLFDQFKYKLGLIAESVEKLPETYTKSVKNDIVNELHNTMFRIQLNDSVDQCIEIMKAVQSKFVPNIESESDSVKEKLNLIKATWESCHVQFKSNFTDESATEVLEITEELTSAVYLSNCFLTSVSDIFEPILEAGVNGEKCDSSFKIADEEMNLLINDDLSQIIEVNMDTIMAEDVTLNNSSEISFHDSGCFSRNSQECNVGSVQNDSQHELIDLTSEAEEDKNAGVTDMEGVHFAVEPSEGLLQENEIQKETDNVLQFLSDCLNVRSAVSAENTIGTENVDEASDTNSHSRVPECTDKSQVAVDNKKVLVNYCLQSTSQNSAAISCTSNIANDIKLSSGNNTSKSKDLNARSYEQQLEYYLKQLHPKTKEGVFQAISKVAEFLREEEIWARKMSRKSKQSAGHKQTRRSKLNRPKIPADVQIYMKLGILPWDLKNKSGPPADDSHCQFSIPSDIKVAIMRYRSWYPTMHDKLYCFENHSMYLFDMELFGCWECIRKYYNDIYKWANKMGLVLRQIRQ